MGNRAGWLIAADAIAAKAHEAGFTVDMLTGPDAGEGWRELLNLLDTNAGQNIRRRVVAALGELEADPFRGLPVL